MKISTRTTALLIPVLMEEYKNEQDNPQRLCDIIKAAEELELTETAAWMVDNLTPNERSYYDFHAGRERGTSDDVQEGEEDARGSIPVVKVIEPLNYPASAAIREKQAEILQNAIALNESMRNRKAS